MEPAIIDIQMNSVGIINSILSAQVLRYCVFACISFRILINAVMECCSFFMPSEFDTNSITYFMKRRVKRDTNLTKFKETFFTINAC